MSIMDNLADRPDTYSKAQHIATTLLKNGDLPDALRVHALMVLGVTEEEKAAEGGEDGVEVPLGKEAMRQAVALIKGQAEGGHLEREGAENMIRICLQNMGEEGTPDWAKLS